MYRVFIKYCVFSKSSRKFATSPPPRQHSASIGCTKNYQEKLYTSIALRALKVSYSDEGEGGVAVNCKKKPIFPKHPVDGIMNICR